MAINYFIGWSQEDLEAELRVAQEDLAAGKATSRAGAGESNTESRIEKTIEDRIRLIFRALNALDPDTYPIDQITPSSVVQVTFGTPDPVIPA